VVLTRPVLRFTTLVIAAGLLSPATVLARGGGGGGGHGGSHSGHSSSHYSSSYKAGGHRSTYAIAAPRDSHGKIARSQQAKSEFKHQHPCPSTGRSSGACPGYVIDHVQPLKRGGADAPSNMQWQTKEAAKAKDKTE
jgi:hypothetical protein